MIIILTTLENWKTKHCFGQSILWTSIPHNDMHIRTSNLSNFKSDWKWLFIAFCLKNPHSHMVLFFKIINTVCQKFIKKWPIGFQEWSLCPQKHHDLNRCLFSHSYFKVLKIFDNSTLYKTPLTFKIAN